MARGRPVAPIVLNDDERSQLLSIARSRSLPHGVVQRAQIVIACGEGEPNSSIAQRMKANNKIVGKWRRRYGEFGLQGLHDELRPGRLRTYGDERVAEVINTALQTRPRNATHWSGRAMAEQAGVSKLTAQRWFDLLAVRLHPEQILIRREK